jgi:DNA-binding SARP family transcriptional activator
METEEKHLNSLHVFLLGAPRLERGGVEVEMDTRKALALLAYLAVTGKGYPRDVLAALLWPEYNQSRARAALRRTLSTLNKGLGVGVLESGRETIGIAHNASYWLDVAEFLRSLAGCRDHKPDPDETCGVSGQLDGNSVLPGDL